MWRAEIDPSHLHGKASAVQRLIAVGMRMGENPMTREEFLSEIAMTEQEKALAILMGVADDLYDTHEVEAGCWARQIEEAIRLLKAQQLDRDQEEG